MLTNLPFKSDRLDKRTLHSLIARRRILFHFSLNIHSQINKCLPPEADKMRSSLFALFAIVTFIAGSSTAQSLNCDCLPNQSNRIVGGHYAEPNEYPWQASLGMEISDRLVAHLCGATILNAEWVMTAAHCALASTNGKFSLPIIRCSY
jgi:hypothetical protein